MRYAVVEGGAVSNIVEAEAAFASAHGWIPALDCAIGDSWDGQSFTPSGVVVIPQKVTRRQARQALLLANKLADVQPAIDAMTDATERGLMQIWWDDSQDFERTNAALISMATTLGLTSGDIDGLFTVAAGL